MTHIQVTWTGRDCVYLRPRQALHTPSVPKFVLYSSSGVGCYHHSAGALEWKQQDQSRVGHDSLSFFPLLPLLQSSTLLWHTLFEASRCQNRDLVTLGQCCLLVGVGLTGCALSGRSPGCPNKASHWRLRRERARPVFLTLLIWLRALCFLRWWKGYRNQQKSRGEISSWTSQELKQTIL